MSFFRTGIVIIIMAGLLGAGCTKGPSPEALELSKPITMTVWGVVDDTDVYEPVFAAYRKVHPNVFFDYRRLRLEEYENALLNALAEDRGPDFFMIHNDWVGKYLPKIAFMPASAKVAYSEVQGTVSKQQAWVTRDEPLVINREFRDAYADVVSGDLMQTIDVSLIPGKPQYAERPMAIPVTVDTMAMYYNKDLMNAAGIPTPAQTWNDFQSQVEKMTKLDPDGVILQSGAAIGTHANISRATDLISVLMMQIGADMSTPEGAVTFQLIPERFQGSRDEPPAFEAVRFYTDFTNPAKKTYTWNETMPNALDAFIQGRVGYYFGYSYDFPVIKARAPKLNFGVSPLPQIPENPIRNMANYWAFAVSKKAKNAAWAWHFLNFLAQENQTKLVVDAVKRPAARKALLPAQLNDEQVGVFASQVLTARTWYHGADPQSVDEAFFIMIRDVNAGTVPIRDAVRFAAEKIGQTRVQ